MKNFILLVFVLSHATFAQDMRPESIEKRIMPLGQVCMEGDGCGIKTAGPGYKVAINSGSMSSASNEEQANKVQLSEGNVHTIEMKNEGADGTMVFEPGVIKVSVGDTINFVLTDQLHNSASLPGMIPAGAEAWTGEINQEISITLDKEGVYVYNCTPHAMMAMVGVIQVGEASNINEIKSAANDLKSTFIKIKRGLNQIKKEIETGKFKWNPSLEDVHMNIESALEKKIGESAKNYIPVDQEMTRLLQT